jgi:hypothetical protein
MPHLVSIVIAGLNFEFLLVLNHDDVIRDYPKMGDLGERISFLDTQFWGE